jgi:uncharacterized membrane protein
MIAVALVLHVLSAIIWIGGMFFAYVCLRPVAAALLEAPQRLQLWVGVFKRFFLIVWLAVLVLPVTGLYAASVMFGSIGRAPLYVHLMLGGGVAMILIFLHVYFAPYRRLRRALGAQDYPAGIQQLARIRRMVGINTVLGILVALVASSGRVLGF